MDVIMSVIQESSLVINKNWLTQNVNEKADYPVYGHALEYSGKSVGAFRVLQAAQKASKFAVQVIADLGKRPIAALERFSQNMGTAVGALVFPRLPFATYEAAQSITSLKGDGKGINLARRVKKAVMDTFSTVAAYGYAAAFITGNPAIIVAAQSVEIVSDLASLDMSTKDYNKSTELEAQASGEAKVALTHTKKYNFYRVVKDIVSIATAILGIVIMATGYPFIPMAVLIVVFSTTLIFSVIRDLFKEMGRYKVINFDRDVKLV